MYGIILFWKVDPNAMQSEAFVQRLSEKDVPKNFTKFTGKYLF